MNLYLNADCMNPETGLPSYPDKHFSLAIVDPPYGMKTAQEYGNTRGKPKQYPIRRWDEERPKMEYFDQIQRVSKNQIIWGGNYFADLLPPSRCWVYWRKLMGGNYADGELAWTSFDKVLREFTQCTDQGNRFHPTQKPVALYRWLLKNYAKPGDLILDTHVGSASSLIAFEEMGFEYVGFELDADYYRDSCKRLEAFRSSPRLFDGQEVFRASGGGQQSLF